MASIDRIVLESSDPAAAPAFYRAAFGLSDQVAVRGSDAATSGFRGFTVSLTVARPSIVDGFVSSALAAGATPLKPAAKSFWGYGGVVQAPDGSIWKFATSNKKDKGPDTREFESMVLLLGVADVAATKEFYVLRGIAVAKSYGRKYVEFDLREARAVRPQSIGEGRRRTG
jgi:predicted lactoylglutathione lyase